MRTCHRCPYPEPKPNRPTHCVRCGGLIDPRWAISTDNTRRFLSRLEDAAPNISPDSFQRFEAQVLRRQKAGETTFRQVSLGRDMQANGNEEASDAAMYGIIGLLQERRTGSDENWDIALEIGACAARIYELNEIWKSKGRGRPHAARAHDEEE